MLNFTVIRKVSFLSLSYFSNNQTLGCALFLSNEWTHTHQTLSYLGGDEGAIHSFKTSLMSLLFIVNAELIGDMCDYILPAK